MKVVFLDIDGVLVNAESLKVAGGLRAPAYVPCVQSLNKLLAASGAHIVVSSAWRVVGLTRIKQILAGWGVRGKVIGITPRLRGQERGVEIREWLRLFHQKTGRQVSSYVVIDDNSDMADVAHRLVQTNFYKGLTDREASRAAQVLQSVRGPLSLMRT